MYGKFGDSHNTHVLNVEMINKMCFIQERCVLSYKFTMKFGIVLCKTPKKVSNTKFIDKLTLTHKKNSICCDFMWSRVSNKTIFRIFITVFHPKFRFIYFMIYFFFLFVKRKQFTFKRPSEYLTLIKCILDIFTLVCYIHAFWSMNKVAVNNSRKKSS